MEERNPLLKNDALENAENTLVDHSLHSNKKPHNHSNSPHHHHLNETSAPQTISMETENSAMTSDVKNEIVHSDGMPSSISESPTSNGAIPDTHVESHHNNDDDAGVSSSLHDSFNPDAPNLCEVTVPARSLRLKISENIFSDLWLGLWPRWSVRKRHLTECVIADAGARSFAFEGVENCLWI